MKTRDLVLAALIPLTLPGIARAQDASGGGVSGAVDAPANVSVLERARPDYAPIGGRIGSFFLYPTLDVTAQYTSNLRATSTGQVADSYVSVRPAVKLVSNWVRNQAQVDVFYQRAIHARFSDEDAGQYGANGAGRIYLGSTTLLDLSASVARLTEPRTDINSIAATQSPIGYTNISSSVLLTQNFAAFTLLGSAGVSKQTFSDAVALDGTPVLQQYRNNSSFNGSLEGRYRIGAGTSLLVHVGAQSIGYDLNPYFGFDRNSSSTRAELGVGLALSRLLYGDVRVGYFKQFNRDARFLDGSGLSFSANLLYSLTPLTSIRLTADRSIEPGGSTVTSGNMRSTGTLTVEHELHRNIILTGFGRYSHIDPQGALPLFGSADEYEGRGGVQYYLNRRLRANAGVSHYARRGQAFSSVDVTSGSLGFIVSL